MIRRLYSAITPLFANEDIQITNNYVRNVFIKYSKYNVVRGYCNYLLLATNNSHAQTIALRHLKCQSELKTELKKEIKFSACSNRLKRFCRVTFYILFFFIFLQSQKIFNLDFLAQQIYNVR